MTPYQYSDLDRETDEIRLVDLLPSEFDDPICIQIHHAPLKELEEDETNRLSRQQLQDTLPPGWLVYETIENRFIFFSGEQGISSWTHPNPAFDYTRYAPIPHTISNQYEALSYVWGTTEHPETISVITGHVSFQPTPDGPVSLSVGPNLACALRHLRYANRRRTLWIDAICINQKNDAERSEEVQAMGDIYGLASRVVVWLGQETPSSSLAMSAVDYLGRQVTITLDRSMIPCPGAKEKLWCDLSTPLPYNEKTWQALERLIQCAWFERLWVTQEIILGSKHSVIQYGSEQMQWPTFRNAMIILSQKVPRPPQLSQTRLEEIRDLVNIVPNGDIPVSQLLRLGKAKKCADPRDRVYGHLSMFAASFADRITPNYSSSVSKTYKRFFRTYLRIFKSLNLLRFCTPLDTLRDRPSWVPDFSLPYLDPQWAGTDSSSGLSHAHVQYFAPHVLEATGITIREVRIISDAMPHNAESEQALKLIHSSRPPQEPGQQYFDGELVEDVFATTWCLDWTQHCLTGFSDFPTLAEIKEILAVEHASTNKPVVRSEKEQGYLRDIIHRTTGQAFFTSTEGHMGLCHPGVKAGKEFLSVLSPVMEEYLVTKHY
jgi:hypothetical protein